MGLPNLKKLMIVSLVIIIIACGSIFLYLHNPSDVSLTEDDIKISLYKKNIESALDDMKSEEAEKHILEALISIPWRIEAQILFEQKARDKRRSKDEYENYIERVFADNVELRDAVKNAPISKKDLPNFIDSTKTKLLNNPLVWYTSILAEADGKNETTWTKQAINMLPANPQDQEIKIRKLLLIYLFNEKCINSLPRSNQSNYHNLIKALKTIDQVGKALEHEYKRGINSQALYQEVCNILAVYYIFVCSSRELLDYPIEANYSCDNSITEYINKVSTEYAQSTNTSHDKSIAFCKVIEFFNLLLEDRNRLKITEPILVRSPEKLTLYHIYCDGADYGSKGFESKEDVLGQFKECSSNISTNKQKPACIDSNNKETDLDKLLFANQNYKDFKNPDKWLEGTYFHNQIDLKKYFANTLKQGWKNAN